MQCGGDGYENIYCSLGHSYVWNVAILLEKKCMSLEQQLLDLKSKGEKLNSLKIENQIKLQNLEQEKIKLLEECNQLGLDPANIEQTLHNEEATLQLEMSELSTKINGILDEISKV